MLHDVFEFRRDDYALSDDQAALQASCEALFRRSGSPTEEITGRAGQRLNESLWKEALQTGLIHMAVPEHRGGDGAGLVELSIAAEALGYYGRRIPLLESMIAVRALARLPDAGLARDSLRAALDGTELLTCAPTQPAGGPLVVPSGPMATALLWWRGDQIAYARMQTHAEPTAMLSGLPIFFDYRPREQNTVVLGDGAEAQQIWTLVGRELKLLVAAAMVGAARRALDLAIEFASVRRTRGVTIGSLQGIAHPIVDAEVALTTARNIYRKAAWYGDNEPSARPDLPLRAFLHAATVAPKVAQVAAHVHGGAGVALESEVVHCLLRVRGWSVLFGDPRQDLAAISDHLVGLRKEGD